MRRLFLAAPLVLAACANGGGFQVDGIYRDEIATAALVSSILADETIRQIQTGEISEDEIPAALAANEALADVISACRGPATTGGNGAVTCIIGVVTTALTMEAFLTGDEESDEIDLGEALAFLGDALWIADPRMIALAIEIDGLEPGELLALPIIAQQFAYMDASQNALLDAAEGG
jgi:hypothetical protein